MWSVLSDLPHFSNLASIEQISNRCTNNRWVWTYSNSVTLYRHSWEGLLVSFKVSLFALLLQNDEKQDGWNVFTYAQEHHGRQCQYRQHDLPPISPQVSMWGVPRERGMEKGEEMEGRREWDQRASRWDYSVLDFIPNHTPNLSPASITSLSLAFSLAPSLTR